MPVELLVALAILALLAAGGYGILVRATRRTRARLLAARRAHHEVLEGLADHWSEMKLVPANGAGWAALEGETPGAILRLTAGAELKRTTFIRYCTQLHVEVRGRWLQPPGLHLDLANPGQAARLLEGLPEELLQRSVDLLSALQIHEGKLVLMARPGGDISHNYSYGFHLLLLPGALADLWDLGAELGEHLSEEKPL